VQEPPPRKKRRQEPASGPSETSERQAAEAAGGRNKTTARAAAAIDDDVDTAEVQGDTQDGETENGGASDSGTNGKRRVKRARSGSARPRSSRKPSYNADSETITIDPATVSMASLIVDRPRGRMMEKTRADLMAGRDPKARFRRADASLITEQDTEAATKEQSTVPDEPVAQEGDAETEQTANDEGGNDLPQATSGTLQMRIENGRIVVDEESLTLQRNNVCLSFK
jgi:hypothetical protein